MNISTLPEPIIEFVVTPSTLKLSTLKSVELVVLIPLVPVPPKSNKEPLRVIVPPLNKVGVVEFPLTEIVPLKLNLWSVLLTPGKP